MSRATVLGTLLRQHRLDQDLTLETLSERSGISDRTIGDIERGVSTTPQRHTTAALADALLLTDVSRSAFLSAARDARSAEPDVAEGARLRPQWLNDFTGRDTDIARITQLLIRSDLAAPIIISGAPGVGKTSIAVEAVRRASTAGRVELFLDLQGVGSKPLTPLQVLQRLLRQITAGADRSRSFADASAAWTAATTNTSVVVILDDVAMESQVRPVVTGSPALVVIATSRRSLPGIEGAQHLNLHPFDPEHSIAFLNTVIPDHQRAGTETVELADLCGNLPLALRVAAGRISAQPSRTVGDFVNRLRQQDNRLKLLVAGDIAVERAFAASYTLLPETHRALFCSLALFNEAASFSADASAAITRSDSDDTDVLLDELVDLGLVEPLRGGRYRLHDLLRLYANQCLNHETPLEEIDRRRQDLDDWAIATAAHHGSAFAPTSRDQASPAGRTTVPADMTTARTWLISEAEYWFPALQRAAHSNQHQQLLTAGSHIRWFGDRWLEWGHWHEFFNLLATSAHAIDDLETEAQARNDIAYMHLYETFDYHQAEVAARQALDLATRIRNAKYRGEALTSLASCALHAEHLTGAETYAQEAITAFGEAGDLEGELQARGTLANVHISSNTSAAVLELHEILEITADPATQLSDNYREMTRNQAMALLARLLIGINRFEEAVQTASELVELTRDDDSYQARALRHRGFAHLGLDQAERARSDLERALELAGDHRPDAWALDITEALATLNANLTD